MADPAQLRKEAHSLDQVISALSKQRGMSVQEVRFVMDKHGMNLCTLLARVIDAAERREARGQE